MVLIVPSGIETQCQGIEPEPCWVLIVPSGIETQQYYKKPNPYKVLIVPSGIETFSDCHCIDWHQRINCTQWN